MSRKGNPSGCRKNHTFKPSTSPKVIDTEFSSEINTGLSAYQRDLNIFRRQYAEWNPEVQEIISKLRKLAADVHEDQLTFNNNSLMFKQINVESRQLKTADNSSLDFFASLATLATDVIGGINSIAQACNVDDYMKNFGEIMEKYEDITKPIHRARSRCFDTYKNVEEIIRRYHADTFGATINRISKVVNAEHMWLQLKNVNGGNELSHVIEKVDAFFSQISRVEVFSEISKAASDYVDNNPAVFDACTSAGKALYGIYDTWGPASKNSGTVSKAVSMRANRFLIDRQYSDINKLQALVDDESNSQAKLETKIYEAITDLEAEFREMKNLFESSASSSIRYHPSHSSSYRYYDDNDSD